MVDTATQVPARLFVGDSLAWERDLDDYPAGTWTLTYYFANDSHAFSITASASGSTHVVSVDDTTSYQPGRYRWHARAASGATKVTVENGWIEIRPNPAAGKSDWRSHARKMLDAIEAALEGQASKDQLDLISYAVGESINVRRDRELLHKLRSKYELELAREEGTQAGDPRHVYLRFSKP